MTDTPEAIAARIIAPLRKLIDWGTRDDDDLCDTAEREIATEIERLRARLLPSEEDVRIIIANYWRRDYDCLGEAARAVLALFKKPK